MLRNYLVTAYRHLLRHRTTTLMNVISLSIGIAGCLVVYVIVRHEYTYDQFQPRADRMYRMVSQTKELSGTNYAGSVCFPMAEALREEVPAVASATQLYTRNYAVIKRIDATGNEQRFQAYHTIYADAHFFGVFDYPAIAGTRSSLLQRPDEMVLTRSLADRLFGAGTLDHYNALIGQTLNVNGRDFQVSAVLEDVPDRTNVYFHLLLPFAVFEKENTEWANNWSSVPYASQAFFTLAEGYSSAQVTTAVNQLKHRYLDKHLARQRTYHVQPLSDIHTDAQYGGTFFSVPTLLIGALVGLGLIILFTGSINFVNLSTAQSIQRSKEIGIRKVLGGQRRQLIGQFLGEAGLQVFVAAGLAVMLTEWSLDAINQYLAFFSQYVVMKFALDNSVVYFLAGLVLIITLLAGLYPALVLSRYRPAAVLKQSMATPARTGFGARFSLRKVLTVAQFVVVQFLLVSTLVAATQMHYFREQDVGFAQDNVLMIDLPAPEQTAAAAERFRQQALSNAAVEQVALGTRPPTSRNKHVNKVYAMAFGSHEKYSMVDQSIDPHYLSTFDLSLVAGRNLREADYRPDSVVARAALINERAVRELGFASPEAALGQTLVVEGRSPHRMEVVGVLADFVNNSLKAPVQPGYFYYGDGLRSAYVRVRGTASEVLPLLQAQWEALYPDGFFQYEWVNEHIAMLYTIEDMLYRCFRLMAGLALLIGVLGLYGLAAYLTLHRRKEIGIRKVLGATVSGILFRFTREFAGLVVLSFIIAAPLGYFAMRAWLGTFAHRIELHVGFFGVTLLIALTIAALTVGYRALLASAANPVDSLRDE